MFFARLLAGAGLFCTIGAGVAARSDLPAETGQQTVPVFRSTSKLVYLDVTVVDKKGNPVVTGLTTDDFTVTEDKQPQRIFSFEAPDVHGVSGSALGTANAAKSCRGEQATADDPCAGHAEYAL